MKTIRVFHFIEIEKMLISLIRMSVVKKMRLEELESLERLMRQPLKHMIKSGTFQFHDSETGRETISNSFCSIEINESNVKWIRNPMDDASRRELYRLRAELLVYPKK